MPNMITISFPERVYEIEIDDGEDLSLSHPLITQLDAAVNQLTPNFRNKIKLTYDAGPPEYFLFKITALDEKLWKQKIYGPFPNDDPEMDHNCGPFARSDFISQKPLREAFLAFINTFSSSVSITITFS